MEKDFSRRSFNSDLEIEKVFASHSALSLDKQKRISVLKSLIELKEAQKVNPYRKMGEFQVKYTDKI